MMYAIANGIEDTGIQFDTSNSVYELDSATDGTIDESMMPCINSKQGGVSEGVFYARSFSG